jgi:hypothetical protein
MKLGETRQASREACGVLTCLIQSAQIGKLRLGRGKSIRSFRTDWQRIAATLDAVPFVTFCNLTNNLNTAMRGELLDLIEVGLLAVGGGPTLAYADATAFLAGSETVMEKVRRRWLQ